MSPKSTRTIINVVSGKGGTGKTLLACVLADMLGNAPDAKTIVVDLDVFVRGLTSLLYFHREERLRIAAEHELPVASFFVRKLKDWVASSDRLAVAKYRSFDVVPAVATINEILNFQDIVPNDREEANAILTNLLNQVADTYRFVILDSRAGYDELIAATHQLSDVSICVEEQDPISRVTADNLVAQLSANSRTQVFRLVNKARGIKSEAQLTQPSAGVTDLGLIPFDMDVMNSFGSPNFWNEITRSLYRSALARVWNRLASKLDLGVELHVPRVSPVASEALEARVGFLAWKDRIFLVYGFFIAVFGLGYGLFGSEVVYVLGKDPLRSASLIMGVIGLVFSLWSFLRMLRP